MTLLLTLPLPPSVNGYWRSVTVRPGVSKVLISREGRAWKKKALQLALLQRPKRIEGDIEVVLTVHFRDRRRDLDNACKPLLDLLQAAGVYENDRQITRIRMERLIDKGNPRVEIEVRQAA